MNISIDELQKSPITTIPDEIVKKHILLKKYSLNHLINPENNSTLTILFPNGSPLLYDNQPDVFVVSNKDKEYTLTNSIQTRNEILDSQNFKGPPISLKLYSRQKNNININPLSFIFSTNIHKTELRIGTKGRCTFTDYKNSLSSNLLLMQQEYYRINFINKKKDDNKIKNNQHQSFVTIEVGNSLNILRTNFITASGISKNNTFYLDSISKKDGYYLSVRQQRLGVHSNKGFKLKRWPPYNFHFIDTESSPIPTPFTVFTPITPNVFAGCTTKGELYFIELKTTKEKNKYNNDFNNIELFTYKQKLPKGTHVEKIASDPSCPRSFVFVAEKTIEDENNNHKKTKIILYHAYIDKDFTKENKIFFRELEKLNKVPDHIGFHEDYVTISNTYTDTSTDQKKDFGINVRNIYLTKHWLYLAGKLKNKKQT